MSKDLSVSVLMDFYQELLTEKQREALELYYNQDYSLAEIAQHMDISRQGVRDFIKRGEQSLLEFEDALAVAKRFGEMNRSIEQLRVLFAKMREASQAPVVQRCLDEAEKLVSDMEQNA
ncbi:MAG: DNA-binding protein [Ruminococcaceae bacterium]|nr:DNA-binding protein [Oscillospiraceae bacterium]